MKNIHELQSSWPDFQSFADDLGVRAGTAQQWRVRDKVPGEYWHKIVEKAAARKIRGVTFDLLEQLCRSKKTEAA